MNYRALEGFLRGLAEVVIFNVPDYSTICRRVNQVDIPIKNTLAQYEGKEVVNSVAKVFSSRFYVKICAAEFSYIIRF